MHIYKNRHAEIIQLSLGVELGTDKMHCSMISDTNTHSIQREVEGTQSTFPFLLLDEVGNNDAECIHHTQSFIVYGSVLFGLFYIIFEGPLVGVMFLIQPF